MRNVQLVFEAFCDLYTEGLTLQGLINKTKLSKNEIAKVIFTHKGLFYIKKINNVTFFYLKKQRALKYAYTLYKYSNITSIDFNLEKDDEEFINELCNPLYNKRKIQKLVKKLNWSKEKLDSIIEKWEKKGIIVRINNSISFTYLGWPMWAAKMISRIWINKL